MTDDGGRFDPREFERDDRGRPIPTYEMAPTGPGAPAAIAQRAAARLFDVFLVVFLPGSALVGLFGERSGDDLRFPLWVLALSILLAAAYEIVLTATRGATLGKQLMGIRVVRHLDGGRPTWGMSAIRFLVPSVQYTTAPFFQLIALAIYLSAVLHPERRGLHDRASGTVVVRAR
ncbi:MAG TPA: RDD family protein [Acidimicrobiales bacterium]|jgi:uncharacterized RDD family membrane protein YckC